MKTTFQTLFLILAMGFFCLPSFAKQRWTIKGTVKVKHLMPELKNAFGTSNGLAGIKVKVSARSKIPGGWGTWKSWGTLTTNSQGKFSISKEKGSDRRQFKIRILFDNSELRLKEGQETYVRLDNKGFPIDFNFDLSDKDWHEIHNDKSKASSGRKAGVIDLGNIFINRTVVRKHADIWFLFNKIFNKFDSYGSAYSFKKKVVLKYPMGIGNNAASAASYANPLNDNIYIKESHFNASTTIHELMHIWTYHHCTGEDAIVGQLLKHGSTHQPRENTTFVPFLEGFAEWSSYKVLEAITNGKLDNFIQNSSFSKPHAPLNRKYISDVFNPSEKSLANMDYSERGWHSLFNILTASDLGKADFNHTSGHFVGIKSTDCTQSRINLSFKKFLSIFLKHPSKGYPGYLDRGEMDFRKFLKRADAILSALNSTKVKQIKSYLDPKKDVNPSENYCSSKIINSNTNSKYQLKKN